MSDLISRQDALDEIRRFSGYLDKDMINRIHIGLNRLSSAQPEIIRCKDCKNAPKCYGNVVMRSKGGGYIYCPLTYCSEAERRTDENNNE